MMNDGFSASARATPMRWRWPPLNSCGYRSIVAAIEADQPIEFLYALHSGLGVSHLVDDQRLLDDLPHAHAWIERRVRILKHDLHLPPRPPHLIARIREHVLASEQHFA